MAVAATNAILVGTTVSMTVLHMAMMDIGILTGTVTAGFGVQSARIGSTGMKGMKGMTAGEANRQVLTKNQCWNLTVARK